MKTSFHELIEILKSPYSLNNKENVEILNISVDSRTISNPEKTLFIALEGNKVSGSLFIEPLVQSGVSNFIIHEKYKSKFEGFISNIIYVENPIIALQKIVVEKRKDYSLKTIAITGSNGKTTVKEWLSKILSSDYTICKTPKSYNSQIGVPLSVWELNQNHNLGIFEAGISLSGEMQNLEAIIQPNIGLLTNIGDAHQVNFESREEKLREKLKLFCHAEVLIVKYNIVELYNNLLEELKIDNPKLRVFTWGNSLKADVFIENRTDSKKLVAIYKNDRLEIDIPNSNVIFIENCCYCLSVLYILGKNPFEFRQAFLNLPSLAMRLEVLEGNNQMTIINDSYNADIESLKMAVQFLFQQSGHSKKAIILSEILDTGDNTIEKIIELLQKKLFFQLILIGKAYLFYKNVFQKLTVEQIYFYDDANQFLKQHPHFSLNEKTVLIKGARKFELEQIVQFYRKKTHSTYLKIHINAIKHNLTEFAKLLNSDTKIMIMLKAAGYGLGSLELARILEAERVDYFAVAYTDEGVELRKAGIRKPIMVLNPEWTALEKLIDYQLEAEVYSLSMLKYMIDELTNYDLKTPINIHLKLETGMNRLGIAREDLDAVLKIIKNHSHLYVRSIMSHLGASDEEAHDKFTQNQFEQFQKMTLKIENELGYSCIKHISNTEGIIRHNSYQLDMVRLGIGLFGLDSSGNIQQKLQNTVSLISKISQIKQVSKNETVGYSRKGVLKRDSKIAIVNIGYADGYFRSFGNGNAQVFLKGQFAPTLGNVCMDMIMIDITDGENIEEGDEVELMGEHISIADLAKNSNTIPYEILTAISGRVQRVYWED